MIKMEITMVREENKTFFEPLMPEPLWEQADLVLGAVEGGCACGVLAAEEAEVFLEIRYLYVAEAFRRRGIASMLLKGLHEIGMAARMDGELCRYIDNQSTKELDACLSENLYDRDEAEDPVYVACFEDLSQRLFAQEEGAAIKQAVPLSRVTARTWNRFLESLEKQPGEDGTVPDLGVMYLYDPNASFLLIKRGEPMGCILFEKEENDYILSYFCVLGKAAPAEMMSLFRASYQVLKKVCGPKDRIYINTLTAAAEKMVQQMTDQKARPIGQAIARYYLY